MTNVLKERLDDCISTLLKYPNLFGVEINSLKLINQYGKKPVWQTRAISGAMFNAVELTFGIPTTYYEVKRIFTENEVPNLLDCYKLQLEWMEKFGLGKEVYRFASADDMLKMCQYISQRGLRGSISYCSGEDNQTPAVILMDFYEFPEEVKAIHKTTILCPDWVMEREYLDEAIKELLEKRTDLTN
jgi:hypothetical protein